MTTQLTDLEIAELQKKAHAYDSDEGRLQKTQQELAQERAQRAELEQRLAAAEQAATGLDPKATEIFGQDGVEALQNMLAPVLGKLDTIGKRFDEQASADNQARAAQAYWGQLDEKLSGENLPGFASRLRDGDLSSAWSKFLEARPSVRRAQNEADIESVSDAIKSFMYQNKELVAGGGYSPQSIPGYSPMVKCEYSDADYMRDKGVLQRQMENCAISEKEFGEKTAVLYDRWVAAQEKAEQAAAAFGLV